MKSKFVYFILGAIALFLLVFVSQKNAPLSLGGIGQTLTNFSTSTKVAISTSSAQILAAFPQGNVRKICNDGGKAVYLGFGQAAVANEGYLLNAAGDCHILSRGNGDYWGLDIRGITASGTSTVTATQY